MATNTMSTKPPPFLFFLLLLAIAVAVTASTSPCSSFAKPCIPCAGTINCFRADPVCGENNVTYTCGCPDARCHCVRVVKLGLRFCSYMGLKQDDSESSLVLSGAYGCCITAFKLVDQVCLIATVLS
ncbi:hypothetical protein SSX86_032140 [Deinandra increscens subsp. villosa]|uniref:Uncharacterized protein n=1 Tax=Deinandra increscens subsp. villosa TaxID=3103831 RepID=A0AAP0C8A0_9ASTR